MKLNNQHFQFVDLEAQDSDDDELDDAHDLVDEESEDEISAGEKPTSKPYCSRLVVSLA